MIEATCHIKTLLNNSEYRINLCYFLIVSAIPEDPQTAEAFYSVDEFESCSEEDSDEEEDSEDNLPTDPSCQTCGQVRRDPPPERSSCQSAV